MTTEKPFADAGAALKALLAVLTPFLELHRIGARGEHDRLFENLYAFAAQLDATEFRPPVVNVCHTVGADAITGGYLTFAYQDGRRVEHPLDLHGAADLLRGRIHEPCGRLGEEQKLLLAQLEERLEAVGENR